MLVGENYKPFNKHELKQALAKYKNKYFTLKGMFSS